VDWGNLRSAVRLDRDPGRRSLLGHPRDLQADLGGHRVWVSAAPMDRGVHFQTHRVRGKSAEKHQHPRSSRAYAEANAAKTMRRGIEDLITFAIIIFILGVGSQG